MIEATTGRGPGANETAAEAICARMVTARHTELTAARDVLADALAFAHAHPCARGESPASYDADHLRPIPGISDYFHTHTHNDLHGRQGPEESGREVQVPLAGPGTPLVADLAPYELAAALGLSALAGKQLLGDALELAYRLPRVWAKVLDLTIPTWRARALAHHTSRLTAIQVDWVDQVASTDRRTRLRLCGDLARRLGDEAIARFDPETTTEIERAAAQDRYVRIDPAGGHSGNAPGTTRVEMLLDTLHAHALDTTLGDLATAMTHLGDTRALNLRRADAVGVLADPQHALDLLTGHHNPHTRPGTTTGTQPPAPAGPQGPGEPGAYRPRTPATLYLHLTATDLDTAPGLAEGIGTGLAAVTRATIQDWLTRTDLSIRPVIHGPVVLDATPTGRAGRADRAGRAGLGTRSRPVEPSTDAHDPTPVIREHCQLADATCVFPHCATDSRRCDLDHITPFVALDHGGPPAQTAPSLLAPLCRRHHRVKTHLGWDYTRTAPNAYTWNAPRGQTYAVVTNRRRC